MRSIRFGSLMLLAGIALSRAAIAAPGPLPEDDQAAAELKEHHRHHHHGGVAQFIAMSLDTLGEDEAKRPHIEKIQDQLHKCTFAGHEDERTLINTLADGIAAGNIDSKKVDASITQLRADAGNVHDCAIDALNELHATLTPLERRTLVHKVDAHYAVWKHVNHDAAPGGREAGGHLAMLTRELSLTPDQVDKISSALQAALAPVSARFTPEKARAHIDAFGTAFVKDSFDAAQMQVNANADMAGHSATRMAVFYETVMPFLTPEQRATLAAQLREHATHQPSMPGT